MDAARFSPFLALFFRCFADNPLIRSPFCSLSADSGCLSPPSPERVLAGGAIQPLGRASLLGRAPLGRPAPSDSVAKADRSHCRMPSVVAAVGNLEDANRLKPAACRRMRLTRFLGGCSIVDVRLMKEGLKSGCCNADAMVSGDCATVDVELVFPVNSARFRFGC